MHRTTHGRAPARRALSVVQSATLSAALTLAAAVPVALAGAPAAAAATTPASSSPAASVQAPSGQAPSSRTRRPSLSWLPADRPGLSGPAGAVVAGAPEHGSVRVLALTDVGGHPQLHVLPASGRAAAARAVERARALPGAVAVSVDHRVHADDLPQSDDPGRTKQWAMTRLRAEQVWAAQPGNGTLVAVVDSGVDASHPDLAGVVVPGADLVTDSAGKRVDPTGTGETDADGHGTHIAGIIAAVANNQTGVAGLGQGVQVMPVTVLGSDGGGFEGDVAAGIMYAADHGAKVINVSLGDDVDSKMVSTAVAYAQAKDVLVVAAAGNARAACTGNAAADAEGCNDPVEYPAAYPGVLAVAATDLNDASAPFSETGSYVGVAAPGVQILSTYPTALTPSGYSPYAYLSGTSMAAPFVSATAALVRAADPTLHQAQVLTRIEQTADDLGAPGKDDEFGAGLVDPLAALRATLDTAPAPTSTPRLRRLGGLDRIATSIVAAQNQWPSTAGAVVLARSDLYVDALVATPLAVHVGGPLLLTASTSVDPRVLAEIKHVLPSGGRVFLVGSTVALSDAVAGTLTKAGFRVTRLAGTDRYGTAVAVAKALGSPSTVLEATGTNYPDALSAGVAAAQVHGVVLLTNGSAPAAETTAYLAARPGPRYAVGLPAVTADPTATPLAGADRYGTSVAVARQFFPAPTALGFAVATGFADALSGGPVAGALHAPLLLVPAAGALPDPVASYLADVRAGVVTGRIFGSPNAVSGPVGSALSSAVV